MPLCHLLEGNPKMRHEEACIATLLLLLGCSPLGAQQSAEDGEPTIGKGFFMAGWQQLDVEGLNDRVEENGFPPLAANVLSLGGGGWATFGNGFVLGGEGHGLIGAEETASDAIHRSQLTGGYGMLNLGYRAHAGERMDLTPIVGVGGGGMSMALRERGSPETTLGAGGFLFDVSVVADAQVTGRANDGERGVALGVRAGFAYSPADWEWEEDDVVAPGWPGMGIRGFYVRLMIGGVGGAFQ